MKIFLCLSFIVLMSAGCDLEDRAPIEMTSIKQSQALGKEKTLYSNIRMDVGSLEIAGANPHAPLYSYDLAYDKNSLAPEIHYDSANGGTEGRFSFYFQNTRSLGIRNRSELNKVHIAFNNSIPLNLDVNAGVGDVHLSLSGMKLSRVNLEAGVGGAKLTVYEPNPIVCDLIRINNGVGEINAVGLGNLNFRRLEFAGGVGGADLDFTGDWKQGADIDIKLGVGEVKVRMPRDLGVLVESANNLLGSVHLEGFTQRDSRYYSENYDRSLIRVSIRVAAGIGGLRVLWV
jgi:hypothetical protein